MLCFFFFFFNDTATTEIYTLSLHDALPICQWSVDESNCDGPLHLARTHVPTLVMYGTADQVCFPSYAMTMYDAITQDRKSTRLNSSHSQISYAVFCLKKKKKQKEINRSNQQ